MNDLPLKPEMVTPANQPSAARITAGTNIEALSDLKPEVVAAVLGNSNTKLVMRLVSAGG